MRRKKRKEEEEKDHKRNKVPLFGEVTHGVVAKLHIYLRIII